MRFLEPLFGPIVTDTLPPVDTVDGLALSQLWPVLTSQLQPLGPVTDTFSFPPAAGKLNDGGDTMSGDPGQGGGDCVTVTDRFPMVTLPDRVLEPSLAVTSIATVTVTPVNSGHGNEGGVMAETLADIQLRSSLMERSGRHRIGRSLRVASTSAESALGPNDSDVGTTSRVEIVQAGSSARETGKLRLPTVNVPDRASPVLMSTSTSTVSPPDTLDGIVSIQSWSSLTVQLQSLRPFTVTSCVPPAPPKDTGLGDTLSGAAGHGVGAGCVTVNVAPATVRVPLRLAVPVCACAV